MPKAIRKSPPSRSRQVRSGPASSWSVSSAVPSVNHSQPDDVSRRLFRIRSTQEKRLSFSNLRIWSGISTQRPAKAYLGKPWKSGANSTYVLKIRDFTLPSRRRVTGSIPVAPHHLNPYTRTDCAPFRSAPKSEDRQNSANKFVDWRCRFDGPWLASFYGRCSPC
jgi:hypothetical protein